MQAMNQVGAIWLVDEPDDVSGCTHAPLPAEGLAGELTVGLFLS